MEQTVVDNLIQAIVTWIAEHDGYATKTKLLKLLYLFDVEYYRQHRYTFTGFGWKFFHLGPWAAEDARFSVETSDWETETSCHTGMPNGDGFDDSEFEFFNEDGKLAPGMNAVPSRFGPE
jgi:hypothetical protein